MKHNAQNIKTNFSLKFTNKPHALKQIYTFYIDGFKGMVIGKKLWKIILIKLFIMFAILKLFFFPNFLNTNFETNEERSEFILEQITKNASFHTQEESHE
jgi:hypothetical protein